MTTTNADWARWAQEEGVPTFHERLANAFRALIGDAPFTVEPVTLMRMSVRHDNGAQVMTPPNPASPGSRDSVRPVTGDDTAFLVRWTARLFIRPDPYGSSPRPEAELADFAAASNDWQSQVVARVAGASDPTSVSMWLSDDLVRSAEPRLGAAMAANSVPMNPLRVLESRGPASAGGTLPLPRLGGPGL